MNIALSTIPRMISGLTGISGALPAGTEFSTGTNFADALGGAIGQVETSQQSAKAAAMSLLTGGQGDISSVALASQRAELSLEMFQQVRNKFVAAYQEIMKMPM